jgi:hypothetical protein
VAGYEIILKVEDENLARTLIAALKAYGFHPMEGGDGGFPGTSALILPSGIPIRLPEEEAADGKLLAESLIKEMQGR